jgi:hypothetical protein
MNFSKIFKMIILSLITTGSTAFASEAVIHFSYYAVSVNKEVNLPENSDSAADTTYGVHPFSFPSYSQKVKMVSATESDFTAPLYIAAREMGNYQNLGAVLRITVENNKICAYAVFNFDAKYSQQRTEKSRCFSGAELKNSPVISNNFTVGWRTFQQRIKLYSVEMN